MEIWEEHNTHVPAEFMGTENYPVIPGFIWVQLAGSRVSRNTHVRSMFKEKAQWGAIVFWPIKGATV